MAVIAASATTLAAAMVALPLAKVAMVNMKAVIMEVQLHLCSSREHVWRVPWHACNRESSDASVGTECMQLHPWIWSSSTICRPSVVSDDSNRHGSHICIQSRQI